MDIEQIIAGIGPVDETAARAAWAHWDNLCKPLRGFGRMEEWVTRLAAIQGTASPAVQKKAVVIMGADNGVVREGVSQTGPEVTKQVLENMGDRISSVCIMSQYLGAEVFPVNIGMNEPADHPRVLNLPVRSGTGDIMTGPAMTRDECIQAIETAASVIDQLARSGYDLIVTGEMGIGNTTTSAALACVLFGAKPEEVTGRGAGLSGEGLVHKIEVVRRAVEVNSPDREDPIDMIAKVGGLDIAGMAGCYLGAARNHLPVLIDGVISGIAACLSVMMAPAAKDYMFATHATKEPAGKMIADYLRLDPVLYADMHLGEGTGAAMCLPLLDQALNLYNRIPSFAGGKVEQYKHLV